MLILLLGLCLVSLMAGAKFIPASESWQALGYSTPCHSENCDIVRYSRLPRTLAGVVAGVALGLAGVLMQSLTRNPLADPGILGINSGASCATIVGLTFLGLPSLSDRFLLAFVGAIMATLVVALTGRGRGGRLNPIRLTLAGVSLAAILEGITSGLSLLNPDIYDYMRFWQSGSLDIRQFSTLHFVAPIIVLVALVVLSLARWLNMLALGEEMAQSLGVRVGLLQLLGLLCISLLAASATALTGPIAFVGLTAPHLARGLVGSDQRNLLPGTLLLTPILLLFADIVGRLIVPGEIRVSIITAVLGAPVLIWLVRRQPSGGVS